MTPATFLARAFTGVLGLVVCPRPPWCLDELLRRTVRTSCAAGPRAEKNVAAETETIVTIAIDSGDAPKKLSDAIDRRVNAFLHVGDPEWLPAMAPGAGIAALAMAHYASAIAGVWALARGIEERFGLETRFVPQGESARQKGCRTPATPSRAHISFGQGGAASSG